MNNDLEQFSEERLKELAEMCESKALGFPASHAESAALARIALSVKQVRPVCFIGKQMLNDLTEENRSCGRVWLGSRDEVDGNDRIPLYTTPQPAHTEQDGWIKCSERMPDVGSSVLVVIQGKHVHKGHYYQWTGAKTEKGRKPIFEDLRGILRDVTHWMPLPAAPKPESER